MASILVQAIPQITCCSCGSSGSSFSSIGPRQSNKLFTLSLRRGLQRQRKRFFNHPEAGNGNGNNFISPEDVSYLWKLTLGCITGAIVIKYGSILLPDITRPNIIQALFMIGIPVSASILLLLVASSMERQ
ncbi:hypothetical protein SUGI_0484380 [Cryptomeria japonica]|uniref:uncharacterized protein LOC131033890 isoform X1 n=1 Tax=Cryptomeria japonica TaxID=3369 RepID=UPI002408DFC5|nr:uncharacterized protein LOC131033890 isoform X1 [Cryptomeria japonica]GLJ25306.1 hypothetical protein SUGI_0484380 [Cryptomeria japonica]